jgi:hypothetical protein
MLRPATFLASALVAAAAAAQAPSPPPWAPQPPPPPPRAQPRPAPAQPASGAQPQPQPAAKAAEPKALSEVKSLGKQGLRKVAPKKGPAEKLVKKHGDTLVDRAVDLAADQAGVAPHR